MPPKGRALMGGIHSYMAVYTGVREVTRAVNQMVRG